MADLTNFVQAGIATRIQPGQVLNPNGKPKGRRSLSTIVRDLGESQIDWDAMGTTPDTLELKKKFQGRTAFEAISIVAQAQAMAGDNQAREWLRKAGYGDKMDITTNDESLNTPVSMLPQEIATDFAAYLLEKTKAPVIVEGEIVSDIKENGK